MKKKLILTDLNCAHCAQEIEDQLNKIDGIEASLVFATKTLTIKSEKKYDLEYIKKIILGIENVNIVEEDEEIHDHGVQKLSLKDNILFLAGTILFFINIFTFKDTSLYLISYLLVGYKIVLKDGIRNIFKGRLFDERFLMIVATLGAIIINDYAEAVAVLLFYGVGELFQGYAVEKSRKSISDLMNLKIETANLCIGDDIKEIRPEDLKINDIILVKVGEKIPVDGIIVEGNSNLNVAALTGESMPIEVAINDEVLSGSINLNNILRIKVSKEYKDSTIAKILELVENASSKKASTEKFITKFSKYYTPIVVILALLIAIIPPLLSIDTFSVWLYRACIFLVVSCPCALVISIPLCVFASLGKASKLHALVKGGNYLENFSNIDTLVLDKTGTITTGIFEVKKIDTQIEEAKFLQIIGSIESYSNHPIAKSIVEYANLKEKNEIKEIEELAGFGIRGILNNKLVLAGNKKLMNKHNIKISSNDVMGTIIYFAYDNKFIGYVELEDTLKDDIAKTIDDIYKLGIKNVTILSGDSEEVVKNVALKVNATSYKSGLLPADKVNEVEKLLENNNVCFIGDGINDAPVLARANIGISMGNVGSDAAIEASDVVFIKDDIRTFVDLFKLSVFTKKIMIQNIVFAIAVKVIIMILGTIGIANMWTGVFADVGVSLIAIVNSMRVMRN